ncbi:hypothetical protein SAMN05444362_112107 [Dysgonomonas macrotermitis]|uniref:Uncharacterized protein n=1 Tax=Dysgonomonas macrotermitis TaxID=1346286 RepID=A0A1M5FT71_9BACT|nr:hypothetical protein SAMN05444362_112107 [Dysgonomonas macrotermitis]
MQYINSYTIYLLHLILLQEYISAFVQRITIYYPDAKIIIRAETSIVFYRYLTGFSSNCDKFNSNSGNFSESRL